MKVRQKRIDFLRPATSMFLMFLLFFGCPDLHAADHSPNLNAGSDVNVPAIAKDVEETAPVLVAAAEKSSDEYGDVTEEGATSISTATGKKPSDEYGDVTEKEIGSAPVASAGKSSDEYGNVTEEEAGGGEGPRIADPVEPFNRAMYHFNDKVYFWVWKPVARGYKYVVPEEVRGIFSKFYENLKAPIRIVNNFLQGKPGYAGLEATRFLINSTFGVAGLRDCAKECFGINGHYADFGQTLGKYGVGFGFYIVLPLLGPSSPRDAVGWLGDWVLRPQTYTGSEWFSPDSIGLYIHEKVNDTSFHLGEYEMIKGAAIDPYVAMRDIYIQYRTKLIEQ
ncbi:MAG: VacJ family lipoprotein [Syntrophus sp. (in: bacteria)]|nr:VacJ family lipoprotein [Syntrophus sp. (in: bacteria)]